MLNPEDFTIKKEKPKSKGSDFELYDHTKPFVKALLRFSNDPGFGAIMFTIGTFGSGKTGHMCELNNIFLHNLNFEPYKSLCSNHPKRNIALYKAPDKLLDEIQQAVPKHLKERFRIVDELYEVKKFDVLDLDEGYLSANAHDALRKSAQYFIESIVTIRHKGVVIIVNSPDDGILRGIRRKSQFRFYKALSRGFLYDTKDKFAKRYMDILPRILQDQTLFETSHMHFLRKRIFEGVLEMEISLFCPWFNDKISKSFSGESFDAYLRKIQKVKDDSEKLIEMLMTRFDTKVDKINRKLVRGMLWDEFPKLFTKFEENLTEIIDTVKWRVFKQQELDDQTYGEPQYLEVPEVIKNNSQTYDDSCAQFFKAFYSKNLPEKHKNRKLIPDLIYDWICGSSQRNLSYDHNISLPKTNKLIQKFKNGEGLDSDLLRLSTVYEIFIARQTMSRRAGGKSDPDVYYYDDNDQIMGPGECKLIDDISSTITFFQEHTTSNYLTLTPSYLYCKENQIDSFPLFLRNPKWIDADLLIPIRVNGPNKITVHKSNLNEYIQNFDGFMKFEFFFD